MEDAQETRPSPRWLIDVGNLNTKSDRGDGEHCSF